MAVSTILVAGVFLFILGRKDISFGEIQTEILQFGWPGVIAVFALNAAQIGFMFLRYYVIIPSTNDPGLERVAYSISLGQWLNAFVPARAGDLLKAVLLSRRNSAGERRMSFLTGVGVIAADRVIDIATLFAIILVSGAFLHPGVESAWKQLPSSWVAAGTVIGSLLLGVLGYVFKDRLLSLTRWLQDIVLGFKGLLSWRRVALAVFFAFLGWYCEIIAIQVLTGLQGVTLSFGDCVFVLVALNLAISVPVSLANVGPFEAAMAVALQSFGVPLADALAIATVHHALQLGGLSFWALLAVIRRPR